MVEKGFVKGMENEWKSNRDKWEMSKDRTSIPIRKSVKGEGGKG